MTRPRPTVPTLGADLKLGDVIHNHGYAWRVLAIVLDPKGNTGTQERYCLTVEALPQADQWNLITGSVAQARAYPITFGLIISRPWAKVV